MQIYACLRTQRYVLACYLIFFGVLLICIKDFGACCPHAVTPYYICRFDMTGYINGAISVGDIAPDK